jgi:2-keto-3-deoxy-L-rhamnonate aldolase RhmA
MSGDVMTHPLIDMVQRKVVPLGMQCFTSDPAFVEALGHAGFDFVMLDTEHAPNDTRAMEGLVRAAECAGLIALVRVPDARSEPDVRRALEAGATGVFLPMVRSADDVRAAAAAAFFPPKGERGVCPAMRAAHYSLPSLEAYCERNNDEALLIPIIEHPDAVEQIDAICADPDVHAIAFGVGDLSYAIGEKFKLLASPKVRAAYDKVLASARAHGVAVVGGPVLGGNADACRQALEEGITIFIMGLDVVTFRKTCEQTSAAVSAGIEGSDYTRSSKGAR